MALRPQQPGDAVRDITPDHNSDAGALLQRLDLTDKLWFAMVGLVAGVAMNSSLAAKRARRDEILAELAGLEGSLPRLGASDHGSSKNAPDQAPGLLGCGRVC